MESLEQIKATAPKLQNFGETQYIIRTENGLKLFIAIMMAFGNLNEPWKEIGGYKVISWRSFQATDYANDQQGEWHDAEDLT